MMNRICFLIIAISISFIASGQEVKKQETPVYKLMRQDEDYAYLKDSDSVENKDFWNHAKYIRLNGNGKNYLSFGGEFRPRYQIIKNEGWEANSTEDNFGYYTQRLAVHSNLVLGKHIRFFTELYHGLTTSSERPRINQDDEIDINQAFVDIKPLQNQSLTIRVGRQQMVYGAGRLVALRDGLNVRRSFDGGRFMWSQKKYRLEGFWGSEVKVQPYSFDNVWRSDMQFWGTVASIKDSFFQGATELYYFGFANDNATFNNVVGEERRQTVGVRRSGHLSKHFYFNTEITYQFGDFAGQDINALAIEFDYHYKNISLGKVNDFGIKLDYVSGDNKVGDSKLQTFNPLFNNPTYFGLAAAIAPVNLIDIHPSISGDLSSKTDFIFDWDFFWRASTSDGVYSPPKNLRVDGSLSTSRFIGHQPSLKITHQFTKHITYDFEFSYFFVGQFLADAQSENIFFLANTFNYKF